MSQKPLSSEEIAQAISEGDPIDWKLIEASGNHSKDEITAFKTMVLVRSVQDEVSNSAKQGLRLDDVAIDEGFELLEELGQGAYSKVYKARDKALNREVALKILKHDLPLSPFAKKRFIEEARVLASLDHPNIVRVFSIDRTTEDLRLCLERVDGKNLSEIAEVKDPFTAKKAAYIGIALCRALKTLHDKGLVHRDLKPSNIMYTSEDRVVLLDFGLSHSVGPEDMKYIPAGLGTPLFMAPEQYDVGADFDHRIDIYALGIVLYWLVSKAFPVMADSYEELHKKIKSGHFEPLDKQHPEIPAEFQKIVSKATAFNPEDRFADANELKAALQRFVGSLSGKSGGSATKPKKATRQILVGCIAVFVLAALYLINTNVSTISKTQKLVVDPQKAETVVASKPSIEKILFSAINEDDGQTDIFSINPDGSCKTNLTSDYDPDAKNPSVSPDGAKIAFAGIDQNGATILCMNSDGSSKQVITDPAAVRHPRDLRWFNNKTIWRLDKINDQQSALFSISCDGAEDRIVKKFDKATTGCPTRFVLSPDRTKILLLKSKAQDAETDTPKLCIEMADIVSGASITNIKTIPIETQSQSQIRSVFWSGDSSQIYYLIETISMGSKKDQSRRILKKCTIDRFGKLVKDETILSFNGLHSIVESISPKSPLINSINHTKFRSTHIRRFDFEK